MISAFVLLGLLAILVVFAALTGFIAYLRQDAIAERFAALQHEVAWLKVAIDDLRLARGVAPTIPSPVAQTPPAEPVAAAAKPDPLPDPVTPPPPPQSPPPLTLPPPPMPPRIGLEERLGASWTVWAGGLALALGAIFLVRYAIEQGLIGPATRVLLGALFSGALVAMAEFMRRRERAAPIAGFAGANIPAVLAGAGIIGAFATVYAAYALYALIGALPAFILLGAVSIASLVLASVHGSILAALGLIGSYATPLLVSTEAPSAIALFTYLLGVTGACYLTAWLRGWLWLAIGAAAVAIAWGLAWFGLEWQPDSALPVAIYAAGLAVLALVFLTTRDIRRPALPDTLPSGNTDWTTAGILAATSLLVLGLARVSDYGTPSLALLAFFVVVLIGAASQRPSLVILAPVAAVLFLIYYMGWHLPALDGQLTDPTGIEPARNLVTPPGLRPFLMVGALFSGGIALAALWQLFDRTPYRIWAGVATLTPLITFAYAYWRATDFTQSVPFGTAGLLGAAGYAVASEVLNKRRTGLVAEWSVGALAAASAAALALAATMILSRGWLTIALAMLAPALAAISLQRPIPVLRWIAAVLAGLVVLRLAYDPRIVGDDIGQTPVFNWLLYGYGVPSLAFFAASRILRRAKDDLPVMITEGAAVAFLAALASLEVRHLLHSGQVFSPDFDLAEAGLQTSVALGLAIGLRLSDEARPRLVSHYGWQGFAALSLVAMLLVLLIGQNPMLTESQLSGGVFWNDLLLGYAIPALLAALLYWRLRRFPPTIQTRLAGGSALAMAFAWLTFETTRIFQGPVLRLDAVTQELSYTYSAIWLVFAILLLAAGIGFRATALRHGAFAVLLLVILKVFLLDMAGLTGLLRALSFIGLGLALVGIGYAYQKLVFPKGTTPSPASTANP